MYNTRECELIADFLQGLTNSVRLKIICCLLSGEKNVTEIVNSIGEKQSNVSHQLKILNTKGIISRRKEERRVYYSLEDSEIRSLIEQVRQIAVKRLE